MTFYIPIDLETTILAAVQEGHFASVDAAMTEAARLLIREHQIEPEKDHAAPAEPIDPLSGIWHDFADEMDEIVAETYRQRLIESDRIIDSERSIASDRIIDSSRIIRSE